MEKVESVYYVISNNFLQEYSIRQVVDMRRNKRADQFNILNTFSSFEDAYNYIVRTCLTSEWRYNPDANEVLLDR